MAGNEAGMGIGTERRTNPNAIHTKKVAPEGIEPPPREPESLVLSIKLRSQKEQWSAKLRLLGKSTKKVCINSGRWRIQVTSYRKGNFTYLYPRVNPLPRHTLSKSAFLNGMQCLRRLYFQKFRPDLLPGNADEVREYQLTAGIELGILARKLFPGGIEATASPVFDEREAVLKTAEYLQTHEVIYEACFEFEGCFCAVDLLVKRQDLWYAYEVKGSNVVKAQHMQDAAFQYAVMKGAGLPIGDIRIVHFNKEYIRQGDLDVQQLFTSTSVRRQVLGLLEETRLNIQTMFDTMKEQEDPCTEPGAHCQRPYVCPYKDFCHAGLPIEVLELPAGKRRMQRKPLQTFLHELDFPLSFFDFEAYSRGIPPFNQTSPFQPIPFQYSLHRLNDMEGKLSHHYFLGDGLTDPREQLIRSMIRDLGKKGSILTWSVVYERGIIKRLMAQFPLYEKELNAIHQRMADLMIPFKEKWVVLPAAGGSASLKRVLPAMFPAEQFPDLCYDSLAIGDGMAASYAYAALGDLAEEERETVRQHLLVYCHLDTLAMVRIWEKLHEFLKKK